VRSHAQLCETDVDRVLSALGSGHFLLTSHHGGKRAGITTRWVMACAHTPLLVSAAVRRGHWIAPLIRDSHTFAICAVDPGATLLLRKCAETSRPRDGDPFDCLPTTRLATGSPIIEGEGLALDCEVRRHIDLEADYELYVGLVVATRVDGVVTRIASPDDELPLEAPRSARGQRP
jgi:flavin reductase (DIM6/NTAB) family NADH-FMN oxidoreductase RutF